MTSHRRRCLTKAILEIKGRLSEVSGEELLDMSNAELLTLFIELEKLFDEGATITEPGPDIQDMKTIAMEPVLERKLPPKKKD